MTGPDAAQDPIREEAPAVLQALRERGIEMPILVMSMHDESFYAERALRAGAQGYVMKQRATAEIATAIERVLAGDLYLSDALSAKLLRRVVDGDEGTEPGGASQLSDRELEVLQLLGQGVSTRDAAKVMAEFGLESLSSTQVSRAAALLDKELEAWRARTLGQVRYRSRGVCEDVQVAVGAHAQDAAALYEQLETAVIPEFYDRDADGLPRAWIERMRHAMATVPAQYSAQRMLIDYLQQMYHAPAEV